MCKGPKQIKETNKQKKKHINAQRWFGKSLTTSNYLEDVKGNLSEVSHQLGWSLEEKKTEKKSKSNKHQPKWEIVVYIF